MKKFVWSKIAPLLRAENLIRFFHKLTLTQLIFLQGYLKFMYYVVRYI